jgi:hypothetical protein
MLVRVHLVNPIRLEFLNPNQHRKERHTKMTHKPSQKAVSASKLPQQPFWKTFESFHTCSNGVVPACARGKYAVESLITIPGGSLVRCCCNSKSSSSSSSDDACVGSIAWLSESALRCCAGRNDCCGCPGCSEVCCNVSVCCCTSCCLPYGSYAINDAAGGGSVPRPHVRMGYARPLRHVSLTGGKYWRYASQAQNIPSILPVITSKLRKRHVSV